MKKFLGLFIVLVMAFTWNAPSVFAEDDGLPSDDFKVKREEVREEMKLKREEMKKEWEAKREEAKTKMEALRESVKAEKDEARAKIKEARVAGREKALERFDNAVERMNNLKERVNAQIEKLTAKGIDTEAAEGFVATAETKLGLAKEKIAEATTLLATSIDQLTAQNKTKLRTLAQETQTLLKE